MRLALHPSTKIRLEQFVATPSHAILLQGPVGIGKATLATALAAQTLHIEPEQLAKYPYVLHIQPDKGSISIDTVRSALRFLQRKTIGTSEIRRFIIIENAEALTIEAQNALLKALEEPPADTCLLLTAAQPRQLLPTIRSRLQNLPVYTPSQTELEEVFDASPSKLDSVMRLSGGLPGLLQALLQEDETHPLYVAVSQAKSWLTQPLFGRLAAVDSLASHKEQLADILTALERIAQSGLEQAALQDDPAKLRRWQRILTAGFRARLATEQNANSKLLLTDLALQL